jgi:hypothetical protein
MSIGTILIIVLILILIGALPTWPYSSAWGYYPSGGLGPRPAHPDHPLADRQAMRG